LDPSDAADLLCANPREGVFGFLTPVLAEALPETAAQRRAIKAELKKAGRYEPFAYQNLSAIRYAGLMLSICIFGTLIVLVPRTWEPLCVCGLVAGMTASWIIPVQIVRARGAKRMGEIVAALPDLLDAMSECVDRGMNVRAALLASSRELESQFPTLVDELAIVWRQAEIGTLQQALQNFAHRIDAPEIQSFASLILKAERSGSSVSEALSEESQSVRESLRRRKIEHSTRTAIKLLISISLGILTTLLVIFFGPAIAAQL
jgi:tight adherence protein C